jgi:hypothetical protein
MTCRSTRGWCPPNHHRHNITIGYPPSSGATDPASVCRRAGLRRPRPLDFLPVQPEKGKGPLPPSVAGPATATTRAGDSGGDGDEEGRGFRRRVGLPRCHLGATREDGCFLWVSYIELILFFNILASWFMVKLKIELFFQHIQKAWVGIAWDNSP